jgi:hypothetical protein
MKAKRWIPLIMLVVFTLPFAVRFLSYYRGSYQAPEISTVDPVSLVQPTLEHRMVQDTPVLSDGRVIIDLSKENNLQVDDLTPLRDRLAARGLEVVSFTGFDSSLAEVLNGATALVVAVPTLSYPDDEVLAVRDFVQDGGRLLLVADPTRPIPASDDDFLDSLLSLYYSTPATPEINSLANPFGIMYFADYLYNLVENAGNYRNVLFQPGIETGTLVEGVESVVFLAAHSLSTEGEKVFVGDANTLSNTRPAEKLLSPAVISPNGQVLALGDLTFMTPAYHTRGDNDRFLSNLADWLASGQRDWSLEEFPYLFHQPVDIVQTFSEAFEPGFIAAITPLKGNLEAAGLQAGLSQVPQAGHDMIYLTTFETLEPVQEYLDNALVTISVPDELQVSGEDAGPEAKEIEAGTILVEGWGTFQSTGASLFVVDQSTERTTLVVMAEDEDAISVALDRMAYNDFSGCESNKTVRVCPNDAASEFGAGSEEQPEASGDVSGSVFILSVDAGDGGFNSAYNMESVFSEAGYEVVIWSTYSQGLPASEDLAGYDVYVVDSGDFAWDENVGEAVSLITSQSASILITGEQPLNLEEQGNIVDLEVADALHPVAQGFEPGQILSLYEAANPVPADVLGELGEVDVIFSRGPSSEQAGGAAIVASEEYGYRYVLAAFALYRLPEEALSPLLINIIDWLMFRT